MKKKSQDLEPINWTSVLILFGYGFITVFFPDFNSFDTNGPNFLAITILNFLILASAVLTKSNTINSSDFFHFIKTKIGILYTALILISLVSFVKSINIPESIIHFSKIFNVFTAVWILSSILLKDKKPITHLAIAMAALLLFDSIQVFIEINNYINRKISDIIEIKAGYSNKNILSAAILIKLPFSIFLLTFQKSWRKTLGLATLFFGILATLFLSTRSMYLALIVIPLFYIIFIIILYLKEKNKSQIKLLLTYLTVLISSWLIFSYVQSTLYPKTGSIYDQSVTNRLATIQSDVTASERSISWGLTKDLIKKDPLLGVGLGNWKIRVLEKENLSRTDFTYHYKVHNDFLEIIAETGIFGGLCFVGIFFFSFSNMLNYLRDKKTTGSLDVHFLATFGLIAYCFDALFNFPQDRPEIQSLFIIYLSLAIANSENITWDKIQIQSNQIYKSTISVLLILTIPTIYFLYLNVKSLQTQRLLKESSFVENKMLNSNYLTENFPKIPNLSSSAEPINTIIASYLIKENKFQEVLNILKDNPNPFDTKREFYISTAYLKLNQLDSAEKYIKIAYTQKPKYYIYAKTYSNILEGLGRDEDAIALLDSFSLKNKGEIEAWKYAAALNSKIGNIEKALQLMDSASYYFPSDTLVAKLKESYTYNLKVPLYQDAIKSYNNGNYKEAANYFEKSYSDFEKYGNRRELPNFLNSWAHSLLQENQIAKAKEIFERVSMENPKDYFSLKNLGFIATNFEKDYKKAINYYTKSLEAESPDYFQTYVNLGTLHLIQNQKDLAISNYENSLKYGQSEIAIRNLILLWKEKGNMEKSQYYESLFKSQ